MLAQVDVGSARQDRDAIVFPLRIAHHNFMTREIQVLDAQLQTFEQTQATSIKQQCYKAWNALELLEDETHFFRSQYDRDPHRRSRSHDVVDPGQWIVQYMTIEKQQRGERLALSGSTDVILH